MNLEQQVLSKLAAENLDIKTSSWSTIVNTLNKCALPRPLIRAARQMRNQQENNTNV